MDFEDRKVRKAYFWRIKFFGSETWVLGNTEGEEGLAGSYGDLDMEQVSQIEREAHVNVLKQVKEERLITVMENRPCVKIK